MKKIDYSEWKPFRIDALFTLEKGTRLRKVDMKDGNINYIGATDFNNCITAKISNDSNLHEPGAITVAYNGSVGASFYQEDIFWASDDINVLRPKFEMNRNIALFMCTLLRKASARYEFIDKWKLTDMEADVLYLPVDDSGSPDWKYMEAFMEQKINNANKRIDRIAHDDFNF